MTSEMQAVSSVSEPSNFLIIASSIAWWLTPYVAYFLGIFINYRVFSKPGDMHLANQMLLGIPASLIIASLYVGTYLIKIRPDIDPSYVITLGILMFHGFSVSESANHYRMKFSKPPDVPGPGGGGASLH